MEGLKANVKLLLEESVKLHQAMETNLSKMFVTRFEN